MRTPLIWIGLMSAIAVPIIAAATSPLLAWRTPVYIMAGFAGIIGLALLLIQPLLAGSYLALRNARALHRIVGILLVATIILHVGGLWITSPPDVIDALLFASPTPFSIWGVIAMWAVFATALVASLRRRLRPKHWRQIHVFLAIIISTGTVAHALLIEGTMEPITKAILCALVLGTTLKLVIDKRIFGRR